MERIGKLKCSYEQKKKDMSAVYNILKDTVNKTLIFIDKAYNDGKINISDYNEMNVIIENLNSYFAQMYGKFGNIEEEIVNMVKNFYDPKVEEKGIQKGMEKGKEIGMEQGAKKSNELLIKLLAKRFGNLPEELKSNIMSLTIDKVNEIGEAIFDFNSLEDVNKFLH